MKQKPQKRSIQVKIFGTDYSLKSDRDIEYVEGIARYVDEKLQKLSRGTNVSSQTKIAVLTALNIAEELHRLKREHSIVLERLEMFEDKSHKLCDSVQDGLNEILEVKK